MKKIMMALLVMSFTGVAMAQNVIRATAPIASAQPLPPNPWIAYEPMVSDWTKNGDLYDCQSIYPRADMYGYNQTFTQKFSGCSKEEIRTTQKREINKDTGEIRNKGVATIERRTITGQTGSRTETGTLRLDPIRYAISGGVYSGFGAGYFKQIGGYNLGNYMDKTAGGHQLFFTASVYSGLHSVAMRVISSGTAIKTSGPLEELDEAAKYIRPYSGVRLLKSDGTVLAQYMLPNEGEAVNMYNRWVRSTNADTSLVTSVIGQVAYIELFQ